MTRVRPISISSANASVPVPSSKKWRGESTCVPVCALMWSADTFELSPRAIRLIASRLNGRLLGYEARD